MQRIISELAAFFPKRYRRVLLGSPDKPSWFGNVIHSLLNILLVQGFPVLPCGGVLKGYRMKIDWRRHRSFIYGTWEPHVVSAVSGMVSKGDTAIDIGAHIGFYTLLLSKLVGRDGKVIAFEPLPGNFKILEENIRLNQLHSRVRAIDRAVLDRSIDGMELMVSIDESSSLISSLWASLFFKESGETVVVKTVSLDDLMSELDLPVHFIKMDAEGAEELILRGALKTIERYHPAMVIELHHPDSLGEDHPVVPLLYGLDYKIKWLDRFQLTSHILARRSR